MSAYKKLSLSFFFLSLSFASPAQKWRIDSETGGMLATASTVPFGLQMNQWGEVPTEGPFAFQRFRLNDSLRVISKARPHWRYQLGASVAFNAGPTSSSVRLSSAYLGIRNKVFSLRVGRWREVQGLVDTTGSSGSFTWSGNALPLPRVEFGIPEFTPLFGRNSLLAVKGFFAHGWFDEGQVLQSFLHQKSVYIRIGKPTWKLKMYTGFNHQVQWGGRPLEPFIERGTGQLVTQFPSGWETWTKVVSGVSMNEDGAGLNQPGIPANEALNRTGNHLGGADVALEFEGKKGKWLMYKQSYFEDGSLYYLTNIVDGIYGVSYRAKDARFLKHISAEFVYSLSQGGATGSNFNAPQLRGQDGYFSNGIYTDGWTYGGRVIGNPYLMRIQDLSPAMQRQFEAFNQTRDTPLSTLGVLSSRVRGMHVKAQYAIQAFNLSTQAFAIHSLGNYVFRVQSQSIGFTQSIERKVSKRGALVRCRVSGQWGDLLPESIGLETSFIFPFHI